MVAVNLKEFVGKSSQKAYGKFGAHATVKSDTLKTKQDL